MNVQCNPTAWHNQIIVVMVIGGASVPVPVHGYRSCEFDVAPGRGRWLRDLAPRRPVERAPRRSPAGHPEHTAAGRDSDPARDRGDRGLFAPLRGRAQCAHNMDGRGMLMFHSHDKRSYVG